MKHLYIPYQGRQYRDIEHAKRGISQVYGDDYIQGHVKRLTRMLQFQSDDIVLDIGSGVGDTAKIFAGKVQAVHCCDINENYLRLATENCKDVSNMQFNMVEDPLIPLTFLPDNSITKSFASAVFIHNCTEVIVGYLKELKRVLKPNGLFAGAYCVTSKDWYNVPGIIESDKTVIDDMLKTLDFTVLKNEVRDLRSQKRNVICSLLIKK